MIASYRGKTPHIHPSVFVAEGCIIIGDVTIRKDASVWFNAVLRGDIQPIRIGKGSNIQDNAVIHVGEHEPCLIGDNVTVGHHVTLHGCTVGDDTLVGIGAVVLTGAVIGKGAVIAAGCVIVEGMRVPDHALVAGVPGKIKKILDQHDTRIRTWAKEYVGFAKEYKSGGGRSLLT